MDELTRVAYHEAGHAVISHAYGVAIRNATIEPEGDTLGRVLRRIADSFRPDIDKSARARLRAEALIISSMAGRLAEGRKAGHTELDGSWSDIDAEVDLAVYMSGSAAESSAYLQWLLERAKGAVDGWWWAIEAVAVELLRRRTLSSRDMKAVIEEARLSAMGQ